MKTIELECKHCSKRFTKPLKEYTRRCDHGKTAFYCSRRCCGQAVVGNLPDPSTNPWTTDVVHLRGMTEKAILKNTIYTKEQQPFQRLMRNTLKRTRENDLNTEFLRSLWKQQNGLCALSNIPLDLNGKNRNTSASIDRIVSSQGYVQGNVQFVSRALNLAKNSGSDNDVFELLELIVENYPKKSLHLTEA